MSQPPSGQLPPWERPQWQVDGSAPVAANGQPQYGPQYGPPYGAPQYGPQYGAPQYGQLPYGQFAYPYDAPRPRSTRKVLLWCLAGALALALVVVGIVVVIDATASPESAVPAPVATREPIGLGSDPELDRLAQQCHDGAMAACDDLFDDSEFDSEYEEYGDTCAGRRAGGAWAYCVDVYTDTAGATTD